MVFKVQFPLPARGLGILKRVLPCTGKHTARKLHFRFRHARKSLFEHIVIFQILARRSAAAVAVAERDEYLIAQFLLLEAVIRALQLRWVEFGVIGHVARGLYTAVFILRGHKECENLGAVDALPPKQIIGHLVGLVPADLGGHKRIDAAFLEDLRQCGRIAEHIGKPQHLTVYAEFLHKEPLAVQDLTHKAFTRRQVAVCLDPHGALDFPAALPHHFLDLGVQLGRFLFQILIQLRLARHEFVFGIALHEREHRGKRAQHLFARLRKRPKPRHVDVRMPDAKRRDLAAAKACKGFVQIALRRADACHTAFGTRHAQIDHRQRMFQNGFNVRIGLFVWVEIQRDLIRHGDAIIQAAQLVIVTIQRRIEFQMPRIQAADIGVHIQFVGRLGIVKKNLAMVSVKPLHKRTVEINDKLRVDRIPAVHLRFDAQFKIFAAQRIGNLQPLVKPCVPILLAAPAFKTPERTEALVRLGQRVPRFIAAGLV